MIVRATRPLIAVVEDDVATARALGRVLQAGGFEAALYRSVEEFLSSQEPAPMCVAVDVHLGRGSAGDLETRLGRLQTKAPVILMTALDNPRVRAEAVRLGCAGYFDKTSDVEQLLALINALGTVH